MKENKEKITKDNVLGFMIPLFSILCACGFMWFVAVICNTYR